MSLDWFAGLFEGEGYISANKATPHKWVMGLTSVDRDVLEKVVTLVGGKIYGPYKCNVPNRQPQYTWYLGNKKHAVPLLKSMLPLLCSRRRQRAQDALSAYETHLATKPTGPGSRGGIGSRKRLLMRRQQQSINN
jgi:hypothetical protein